MFDPEDEFRTVNDKPQGTDTDRVNGEYHYKSAYTDRIYSDAHYVRADESTTPPRYYTPPERPVRQSRTEKSRKGVSPGALIACCLICAILGRSSSRAPAAAPAASPRPRPHTAAS